MLYASGRGYGRLLLALILFITYSMNQPPYVYSRDKLLRLNKSLPILRATRKSIFQSKLWCPRSQRISRTKPVRNELYCTGTRCGILNSRSVNKKEHLVHQLIVDNDLDFLALTETWLTDDSSASIKLLKPRGYDHKVVNRSGRAGGGVCLIFLYIILT